MVYLLDTCAVSEFIQAVPNPCVTAALSTMVNESTCIAAMTIGEILCGIERLPRGSRKQRYTRWYNDWLVPAFEGRVVVLDLMVMQRWGKLVADLEATGNPMPLQDSLIAAVALAHDLTLVTRDEDHFARSGVRIYNPWRE